MKLILLYSIFFFSGMSSLIAEITWNRMLVLVIGNTVMATSLLLVAFMGGLGFGSRWGSFYFSRFSRRSSSLLPYCILEVCIGIYVVSSPLFFSPLSNLFLNLGPFFSDSVFLYAVRFFIAFSCLFFPAFMMGATYPAIIAGSVLEDSEGRAARSGYLYSINTFGAAIGCLGAGYFLLPKFGAQTSLFIAFLFNMVAALGAFVISYQRTEDRGQRAEGGRQELETSELKVRDSQSVIHDESRSFLRLIGIATFMIGFVALAYEVLLTRLVILFFGNELIVFTLVLTAFLAGTAISAYLGTIAHRTIKNSGLLFGIIIIIAGLSLVIPPFFFVQMTALEKDWFTGNQSLIVGIIMLVPVFFIGSLLPLAIRIFENQGSEDRGQRTEGRNSGQASLPLPTAFNAGRLYALNTFGGMLGAGITNYFLVPLLGTQGTLSIFSLISIALGLFVLCASSNRYSDKARTVVEIPPNKGGLRGVYIRWSMAAVTAVILSFFILSLPQKIEELYTQKLAEISGGDIEPELKLHYEGRVATISIIDFPWLGFRDMFLNGVEEASTRFGHVQLFKLLGLLPVLSHESNAQKEVLMIAFGAGISAGAVLDSGQVSLLDVVDLNPDVEKINDFFKEVNGDVFHNPRFNFIAEDGRNYLLRSPKKYSVIISDSTHPRSYDSWILYTKEFYEMVEEDLLPGGVFAQWIPLSDFSLELYQIMINTFMSVFPNVTLWNIYGTDQAFLLATPTPFKLDMSRLQSQLDNVAESLLLKKYQMDRAVDLSGFFVMDRKTIEKFIGDEKRVNTDDLPYNQKYSFRKHSPLRTQSFDQYQSSISPHLKNVSEKDLADIEKHQALARAMYRHFFFSDPAALNEASEIMADNGNVVHYEKLNRQKGRMVAKKFEMDQEELKKEIEQLKNKIKNSPEQGKSYMQLAKIYLDLNLIDNAEPLLKKALKYSPESTRAYKLMGLIQANKKNWAEAVHMFEYVLLNDPGDNLTRDSLIRIHAEQNNHRKAIDLLLVKINVSRKTELERLVSYQDDVNIAGSYFSINDYENAENFLLKALRKYPGNTVALSYLAHLYRRVNRIGDAKEQLNRILKINPFNNSARQILKDL